MSHNRSETGNSIRIDPMNTSAYLPEGDKQAHTYNVVVHAVNAVGKSKMGAAIIVTGNDNNMTCQVEVVQYSDTAVPGSTSYTLDTTPSNTHLYSSEQNSIKC